MGVLEFKDGGGDATATYHPNITIQLVENGFVLMYTNTDGEEETYVYSNLADGDAGPVGMMNAVRSLLFLEQDVAKVRST